jgi:putative ABC transport system permease protein
MPSTAAGGGAARRAVARWALRLLRREWRQQVLVLTLLTLVVAASVALASAASNTVGVGDDARLGSAQHRYDAEVPGSVELPGLVAAAEARLGTVDVFVSWFRPIPGSVEKLEYRSQDPHGAFSARLLALRQGRYPERDDEVALTDDLAKVLRLSIGERLDLDGRDRRVVGVVENPSDLSSDFALVSPADRGLAEVVAILLGGDGGDAEIRSIQAFGAAQLGRGAEITSRSPFREGVAIAGAVLGVTAIALLLVALVASAGFVVIAQRRLRQLGVLGALGATERLLRLVVLVNGAAVGVIASLLGGVVGIGAWLAFAPRMEEAVGHRIDGANLPWWTVVSAMALTVVAATLAAWWPARVVARVPVVSALSGRPQRPQPVRQSAATAGVFLAAGVLCLALSNGTRPPLLLAGTVATAVGVLLVAPVALRVTARMVTRFPVAVRLALRDLARYQARSGIALAAVSLTLGIPAAIVVTSTAAEASRPLGNLPNHQLLIWTRDPGQPEGVSPLYTEDPEDEGFSPYLPRLTRRDLEDLAGEAARIADTLDATATPLELVTDTSAGQTPEGRLAVTLAQPTANGSLDVAPLFVASAELLDAFGIDPASLEAGPAVLTVPDPGQRLPAEARRALVSDDLYFSNTSRPPTPVGAVRALEPSYSSLPGSFITPAGARQRAWQPVAAGWLIEASSPLRAEQVGRARQIAADAGMLVEAPREEPSLVTLRWGATAAGLAVALGVLAATGGLLRRETEGDLRTLAATGASSGIRRTLSAATYGSLALLGALLGTAGAYLGLAAGYVGDLDQLVPVPVVNLLTLVAGVPTVAALGGWLVSGRETGLVSSGRGWG